MTFALGIDLGGTKVLAGLIDTDTGRIVSTAVQPTRSEHGPDNVVQRMVAVAEDAMHNARVERSEVAAVGIGAAGQVDSARGMLVKAPNLPDALTRVPLTKTVSDQLGLPVHLYNDVAAAAAGEASYGAGRGYDDFVCIFVGTGIGGAIYIAGTPYPGSSNTAGELGHMIVQVGGRICGCGGRGHLEAYASRTAIVRTVLAELRMGRESSLAAIEPDPDPNNPGHSAIGHLELADAVRTGDPLAWEVITEAARYMSAGLVSIINFYNPSRIILGGGVIGEIDEYFELARKGALDKSLVVSRREVEIVQTAMGENPGIVGAAVLAVGNHASVAEG